MNDRAAQPAPNDARPEGGVVISVVVPVYEEAENVAPLVREIDAALAGLPPAEIVYVDDGSGPATQAALAEAARECPRLRVIRHLGNFGQSAAIRTGVTVARGALVVTLDGDGQNVPADVPRLVRRYLDAAPDERLGMVAGQRVKRQDSAAKRWASRAGNGIRRRLLGDEIADTGCGLKAFGREIFLRLPYFDHMHRFLPALVRREGYAVAVEPVAHRPRAHGRSKYGVLDRALVGVVDILGVLWLQRRQRGPARWTEEPPPPR